MRQHFYMGNNTILTTLYDGSKIYVNTMDSSLAPHILFEGYWERWITDAFVRLLRPGMTVLDIGANCGYYSLLAARIVGQSGHVHAFEPNPVHHENLIKSFMINGYGHAKLHKVALSDKAESRTLYALKNLTGSSSLFPFADEIEDIDHVIGKTVQTVKLNEYLPEFKADVIKVDVEGAEPLLTESLIDTLKSNGTIIMEYSPYLWEQNGFNPKEVLQKYTNANCQIEIIQFDSNLQKIDLDELIKMNEKITSEYGHIDLLLRREA